MKATLIVLGLLSMALITFGQWGIRSEAGRRAFDEMAGIIPYFSWYIGLVLLVVTVILATWSAWRA